MYKLVLIVQLELFFVLGALLLQVQLHLLAFAIHQLFVALQNVHLLRAQDRLSLFLVTVEFLKLIMQDSGILLLTIIGRR